MNELLIEMARNKLNKADKILILSGAGLSTEAGIPDFRSPNGLYSQFFHGYSPETILSHHFFQTQPELFYEYLRTRLNFSDVQPDSSYRLLAQLEQKGRVQAVITQNIDSLHLAAGSQNVIELHGTLKRFYCARCGRLYEGKDMIHPAVSPLCPCGGTIRPDVVLFDEAVPAIEAAWESAAAADLLLVLGTSLLVYPAAYLPSLFLDRQKPVIIINRQSTPYAGRLHVLELQGEIGTTLQQLFSEYYEDGRLMTTTL